MQYSKYTMLCKLATLILLAALLTADNLSCNALSLNKALISRRNAILSFSTVGITSTCLPRISNGAQTMTIKEAESPSARLERKRRKPPSKLLRSAMNFDFAVLLMRSSYNAMDELDCVPMDQFQKDFFFIRQAEYLPYTTSLGPGLVKQGDLSDPYYFDFISYAQYATIYRDATVDPLMVFEESQPIIVGEDEKQEFITKVIKRDPAKLSNAMLPQRHYEIVGNKILEKLDELFGETPSAIPPVNSQSTSKNLVDSLKQIVNLFLINGFAFDGKVELIKDSPDGKIPGSQIEITLTAPATLWSGKALQLKKANITNDFLLKTATAFLKRSGYDVKSSLKYTSSQEISTLIIR